MAHRWRALECIGMHFHEFQFGNGLPFDFEKRVKACFLQGWAEREAASTRRHECLSPVELRPLFLGEGPAIGVLITFRQNAVIPLRISS
jgi:hypothetical protein